MGPLARRRPAPRSSAAARPARPARPADRGQAAIWDPTDRAPSPRPSGSSAAGRLPAELRPLLVRRAAQVVDYQGRGSAERWLDLVGAGRGRRRRRARLGAHRGRGRGLVQGPHLQGRVRGGPAPPAPRPRRGRPTSSASTAATACSTTSTRRRSGGSACDRKIAVGGRPGRPRSGAWPPCGGCGARRSTSFGLRPATGARSAGWSTSTARSSAARSTA